VLRILIIWPDRYPSGNVEWIRVEKKIVINIKFNKNYKNI